MDLKFQKNTQTHNLSQIANLIANLLKNQHFEMVATSTWNNFGPEQPRFRTRSSNAFHIFWVSNSEIFIPIDKHRLQCFLSSWKKTMHKFLDVQVKKKKRLYMLTIHHL